MSSILIFALLVVLVVSVLIWAVQRFLPGDPTIKGIGCFIIVAIGLIMVCQRAGLF